MPTVAAPTRQAPRRTRRPAQRTVTGPALVQRATNVADARLLARLISGRAWIALVAVMLGGLVFLQVSMLRLNTGIGRDVNTAAELERANQQLRTTVANLAGGDRIETAAATKGMVMPEPGAVHFVHAGDVPARTAVLNLGTPVTTPPVAQPQTTTDPNAQTAAALQTATQPAPTPDVAATPTPEQAPVTQTTSPQQTQTQQGPDLTAQVPADQQQPTATTASSGGAVAGG